jgi:hypothetical protein
MAERPSSPTPSERSRLDAAAKTKELEEQSKLPYKWTQTIADLEVTIEVPGNFKGKDLDVKIKKDGVKAGIKGQDAVIEVCEMLYWGWAVDMGLLLLATLAPLADGACYRALSPTRSSSTILRGHSRPRPPARRS